MHPYEEMLAVMESALRDYEDGIEHPVIVEAGKHNKMHRLPKKDAHHAILLKLVVLLSALNAAYILLQHGHGMEQAALERIADEAGEDVMFLAIGLSKEMTDLHRRFLDAFWAEEFSDFDDTMASHVSRETVSRQRIRAYIHSFHPHDPSTGTHVAKVIAKTYSGFVHGAAPHVMEVYNPPTDSFSVRGMLGTPRVQEHIRDYWNYLYRGCMAFMSAAKAFGSEQHFSMLSQHLEEFQRATGRQY